MIRIRIRFLILISMTLLLGSFLSDKITEGIIHMSSPAQRHFDKVTAAEETKELGHKDKIDDSRNSYDLMLGKLTLDKKRLKKIKSIEQKVIVKKILVDEYDDYLDGVLSVNVAGVQNIVITTLMLWNIDAGKFERGLKLGKYAILNGINMPPGHDRSTENALVEEIVDQILKHDQDMLKSNSKIIYSILGIAESTDQYDQVTAKIYKLVGILNQKDSPDEALKFYKKALKLNSKIGVKHVITKLEKKLDDSKSNDTDTENNKKSSEKSTS